jgi:type I phosphodiesterase/nucleotide pyrophosphatase
MLRELKMGMAFSLLLLVPAAAPPLRAQPSGNGAGDTDIRSVLLISIDGMHALDFANCANGISGVNRGAPFCPNLARLGESGVTYLGASTSKPSDSFPGLMAIVTGGSPRSAGVFYDVSYDRSLAPPRRTTPYGIPGGDHLCPLVRGTPVGYDEEIDIDLTQLDGGGGVDPDFLPRDPNDHCKPVYPHTFLRVNTIFEVVKAGGGYTAWSDKHPSYEIVNGPSGTGVDDLFTPEINSQVVPLPHVKGCDPLPDQAATTSADDWTTSFKNIQCYDTLKVQAVLNEIRGLTHDGTRSAPVPNLFGMNFQAVSVGQKLVEKPIATTGGYLDAMGRPSAALLGEIQFVDASIGRVVDELKERGLYNSTVIIVSAKHGQSPIDPHRVRRIPADQPADMPPSSILGGVGPGLPVAQAIEDDVSLLWLSPEGHTPGAVATLEANAARAGIGEIFAGPALTLLFRSPATDPRTPDIVVAPDVGVIYTGGTKKIAEHGGFAQDDTNVMMLVANPRLSPRTITSPVGTAQIAPTILEVLGLDPARLQAVQMEGTALLPGLNFR